MITIKDFIKLGASHSDAAKIFAAIKENKAETLSASQQAIVAQLQAKYDHEAHIRTHSARQGWE